jgi:hypothetical protein
LIFKVLLKYTTLSSSPVFSGVRVRSLVLCPCFVDRCWSFCPFTFGHCVVCPSSNYGFWLPLWYLQTLLTPLKTGDELSVGRGSFSCFTSHWLHYIMNNAYDDGVEVNQIVCCIYWCIYDLIMYIMYFEYTSIEL